MKCLRHSVLVLVLIAMLGGGCSSSDLGAKTFFHIKTGFSVGEKGGLVRPSPLADVVLIAPFLHDYGCSLNAVMVGCTLYEDSEAAGAAIMAQWHWSSLSSEQRRERAKILVENLFHKVNPTVVSSEETAFTFEDTPSYHPLQTAAQEDGTLIVQVWTRRPPGMIYAYSYNRFAYRFRPEGTVQKQKIETFSVPGKRVKTRE